MSLSVLSLKSCFLWAELNMMSAFAPTLYVTTLKFPAVALPRVAAGAYDDAAAAPA
jgi:hypothetical protein